MFCAGQSALLSFGFQWHASFPQCFVLFSCFFIGGVCGVCARVFWVVVVEVGGVCGVDVPGDDFCSPLLLLLVSFGGHWVSGDVVIVGYV